MHTPQKETVEVFSVTGDTEKSWSIDRYHLMVGISIISVVAIMGGIVWLASGGGKGSGSSATPYPTGELQFNDKAVNGANDYRALPYPSVRQSQSLLPSKTPSEKIPSKTPTPTEGSTPTPTPTAAPSNNTSDPIPTATPTPTDTPTPTPESTITPSPSSTQ